MLAFTVSSLVILIEQGYLLVLLVSSHMSRALVLVGTVSYLVILLEQWCLFLLLVV